MLRNALGASENSRALAVKLNFHPRLSREVALIVSRAIFVGVTAAVFFVWVASLSTGGGSSSRANCASFGRGGAHCPSVSSTDGRPIKHIDPRQDKPPTK